MVASRKWFRDRAIELRASEDADPLRAGHALRFAENHGHPPRRFPAAARPADTQHRRFGAARVRTGSLASGKSWGPGTDEGRSCAAGGTRRFIGGPGAPAIPLRRRAGGEPSCGELRAAPCRPRARTTRGTCAGWRAGRPASPPRRSGRRRAARPSRPCPCARGGSRPG